MSYEIGYIINMEVEGEYQAVAEWCNEVQTATIEQQGDNYVVVAIPEPTEQELAQTRIAEIDNELAELDLKSIRSLEAIVDGTATQEDIQAQTIIKNKKELLRTERAELTAKL